MSTNYLIRIKCNTRKRQTKITSVKKKRFFFLLYKTDRNLIKYLNTGDKHEGRAAAQNPVLTFQRRKRKVCSLINYFSTNHNQTGAKKNHLNSSISASPQQAPTVLNYPLKPLTPPRLTCACVWSFLLLISYILYNVRNWWMNIILQQPSFYVSIPSIMMFNSLKNENKNILKCKNIHIFYDTTYKNIKDNQKTAF